MSSSKRKRAYAALLVLSMGVFLVAPVYAADAPPYESDPTLSLIGSCATIAGIDPVPDPSCPYPPSPDAPSGRFDEPSAVVVDQSGNEYVVSFAAGDDAKGRIDIFDDEGKFITEFAARDALNATVDSKGNVYVFRSSGTVVRYEPSQYEPEVGNIEYGDAPVTVSTGIFVGTVAIDTDPAHLDQLLVSRPAKISRYKAAADSEPNALIESFEPPGLGSWPEAMAVDSQRRRIYVSTCKNESTDCGILVLAADAPHTVLHELDGSTIPTHEFASSSGRLPVAVDEENGDFFIADPDAKRIYRFAENYEFLSQLEFKELQPGSQLAISNGRRSLAADPCAYPDPEDFEVPAGDACNRHYLFASVFDSKGRVAAYHPSGQTVPVIEGVAAPSIGETEAELTATIFPGGLATEYYFQVTTQVLWESESEKFASATTIPGGTIAPDSLAAEVSVFAGGLVPGETYRFRVVAKNSLGPAADEGQDEAVFTTYDDASYATQCPNEALRLGSSARLPDCRGYELVTPAETNGRPPKGTGVLGGVFSNLQSSPSGEAVSFRIEGGSLPGSSGVGGFEGDPYIARRTDTGWTSNLNGATGAEATKAATGSTSPDQGYNFWSARGEGEGPLVIEGRSTEYLHYPDGHSELIGRGSEATDPIAVGRLITENATHVIFETVNVKPTEAIKLEPNAPPNGTSAVYDRTIDGNAKEKTHVVSLLPQDVTPGAGQNATYQGAAKNGEGIAFSIGKKLYLRVDNQTTYEAGEGVKFAGVSEGGARIFYVEGGNLKALDTTGSTPKVIDFSSTGNVTPVNVSTGGTRAYFVSPSVLGGTNPAGDSAENGGYNLYLSEEGAISFVATVTERDVAGDVHQGSPFDGLGLWTKVGIQVAKDPSRTNPDGSVLLFQSRAEITGYPESKFPQIYRYSRNEGKLRCISCIPTMVPATGGASLESYTFDSATPLPFSPAGFVANLTPDGKRVFFESTEALVSIDTDDVQDVYEWEDQRVGGCTRVGGCVYLISSGQSGRDNFLYAHGANGNDVFFTTGDALTGFDRAGVSIYDARVDGGFPEPVEEEPCVADGCRPVVAPIPPITTPRSPGQGHSGDIQPRRSIHCPKGKRKVKKHGKVRCVKKPKKHKSKGGKAKRRAGTGRGAGR